MPQTGHDELAFAIGAGAEDRRKLIGEDAREERQIAGAVVLRSEPIADCGLALGQGVEITHADASMARLITRQGRATHCPQICARVQAFDLGRFVEQDSARAVDWPRERPRAAPRAQGPRKGVHGAMVAREMGSLERG
jgi:hypothetical protein